MVSDEFLPLAFAELAVADLPHFQLCLFGQNTRRKLLRRHFQREEQHRRARLGYSAFASMSRMYCLAAWKAMLVPSAVLPMPGRPARISRSDGCKPPSSRSMSVKPDVTPLKCWPPRAAARSAAFHGAAAAPRGNPARLRRICWISATLYSAFSASAIWSFEVLFGRRVIGGVDDILADADQAAPHMTGRTEYVGDSRAHWEWRAPPPAGASK